MVRLSGCEEKVADDLGPHLHSKKECESNDRLIHFGDSNTAQSNFFVEQRTGFESRISTELCRIPKRLGISRRCSDISSCKKRNYDMQSSLLQGIPKKLCAVCVGAVEEL